MTPEPLTFASLAQTYGPRLGAAAGIVLLGLVTAWLLAATTRWVVRRSGLEALAESVGVSRMLYGLGLRQGLPRVCGTVAGWSVVLASLGHRCRRRRPAERSPRPREPRAASCLGS